MMNPEFSIIIPIYNTGRHLRATLQSVQEQTVGDWECICVNDGSTDGSLEVIKEFAARDSRFILIDQPNSGISAARNAGLDTARGEYITFLDHDDLLGKYTLEVYYGLILMYQPDMLRAAYRYIPDSYEMPQESAPTPINAYYNSAVDGLNAIVAQPAIMRWFYVWNCCIRRETAKNIRFDVRLKRGGCEDALYMADVWNSINSLVQTSYVSTLHRRTRGSVSGTKINIHHINAHRISAPIAYQRWAENPTRINTIAYRYELLSGYYTTLRYPLWQRSSIKAGRQALQELIDSGTFDISLLEWNRRTEIKLFLRGKIIACYLLMSAMWVLYTGAKIAIALGLRKRRVK